MKLNELEQIVYGLDLIEKVLEIEDFTGVYGEVEEPFIYENDISNIKRFLERALQQLNNLDIKIKEEE